MFLNTYRFHCTASLSLMTWLESFQSKMCVHDPKEGTLFILNKYVSRLFKSGWKICGKFYSVQSAYDVTIITET